MYLSFLLPILLSLRLVAGHASIWDTSMFGFNVTQQTFPYDNRPVVPLVNMPFSEWWFHNHLAYPPHPQDIFILPAGTNVTTQIACDKSATTYYNSSEGGNIQDPNDPNNVCPGSPTSQYHTTGVNDLKGCALGIAYKSNVSEVQPADFTIFTVNQTCVWNRYTDFSVPARMPPCPDDMCICAFFWIHSPDSGSEQIYMNGFQCRITNSVSNVGLATSKVARRCGADPDNGKPDADPGNCTYGAKQPLYWLQLEQNNMFEGAHSPPFYNDLYNFLDGPQNDIFQDSYINIPVPGPNQTELPILNTAAGIMTTFGGSTAAPTLSASTSSASPSATLSSSPGASGGGTATLTSSPSTVPASVASPSATPSSSPGASDGGTTTPTPSPSTAPVSVASPSAIPSSSPSASDGSTTTPSLSPSVSAVLPSSTPSSSSTPQCPSKRSDSAFSRRHVSAERGIKASHSHKRMGRHH